jgi:glycosyltransferase involved in cell wall biosynthesis
MKRPSLAILITTYNGQQFIGELLDNIAAYQPMDSPVPIFIFDDCSTDDTLAVARQRAKSMPLHIFRHPQNLNECENTNRAMVVLERLGFEWVLLVHQDDLMGPWIEYLLMALENPRPDMGMVCSANSYVSLEQDGQIPLQQQPPHPPLDPALLYHPGNEETARSLRHRWFWNMSGSCIRPAVYNMIGGLHRWLKCCGDNDFIVRFLRGGYGILEVQWPAMLKRYSHNSQSSRATLNASDLEGWSYIMIKYLDGTSKPDRVRETCTYLYRCARRTPGFMKRGQWRAVGLHVLEFFLLIQSLAALLLGARWLIPRHVRELLDYPFVRLTDDGGVQETANL